MICHVSVKVYKLQVMFWGNKCGHQIGVNYQSFSLDNS